jgi:hypothetical protein
VVMYLSVKGSGEGVVMYLSIRSIECVVMYLCVRGIRRVSGHVFVC